MNNETAEDLIKQWDKRIRTLSFSAPDLYRDDLAQELRLSVLKSYETYDETSDAALNSWVHTNLNWAFSNFCKDRAKTLAHWSHAQNRIGQDERYKPLEKFYPVSSVVSEEGETDIFEFVESDDIAPDQMLEMQQLRDLLVEVIYEKESKVNDALLEHFITGKNQAEVAREHGILVGTLNLRYHAVVERLKVNRTPLRLRA